MKCILGILLSFGYIAWTIAQEERRLGYHRAVHPPEDREHLWTGWGRWSPCSLTCGEGTRHRRRECVGRDRERGRLVRIDNPSCTGPDKEYVKCQDRKCGGDVIDLREYQCSSHNEEAILDGKYDWIPFYGGPNPCELTCMAKGYGFMYNFGHVTDGTPCKKNSDDLCIEGRCATVGCDGKVGSNAILDNCVVCDGQNANCAHYRNSFDKPNLELNRFEYTDILKVPSGAAKLHVEDHSNNYLAVRDNSGKYVMNGHWVVDWPGRYETDGSVVVYERTGNNETIDIEGPLQEELYIVLMFRDKNPGVEYNFFLPRDKFKEIETPKGSGVIQSDGRPDPQAPVFSNPYNDGESESQPRWKPYKDTSAHLHQSALGQSSSTRHGARDPLFIGSHTQFETGSTKLAGIGGVSPGKSNQNRQESHEDAYLQHWLKAFSPDGSRSTSRRVVPVTPWPDPSRSAGPRVHDLYTPSPSTTHSPRGPPVYPEHAGRNWGQDVHSFREGPQNKEENAGHKNHDLSPNPSTTAKNKKDKERSKGKTKILQYNRLVEVPEFFKYKKPKHCGTCYKKKKTNLKEFCRNSFVIHMKVLDYQYIRNSTRYDLQIKHTYRNTNINLLKREYVWVPNRCRCPDLKINAEYLAMGDAVHNYQGSRELRLIIDENSYVRKYSKSRHGKATRMQKRSHKCSRILSPKKS